MLYILFPYFFFFVVLQYNGVSSVAFSTQIKLCKLCCKLQRKCQLISTSNTTVLHEHTLKEASLKQKIASEEADKIFMQKNTLTFGCVNIKAEDAIVYQNKF